MPVAAEDPARRAEGQITGTVSIEGIVRAAPPANWFTPDNQPDREAWYRIDLRAMAAHAGVPPLGVYVEAAEAAIPGGLPIGGRPVARIVNNHLQYAIIWYGLAVVLLVVYVFFRRGERSRASREKT